MKFLLDTHIVLWWLDDSPLLLPHIRTAMESPYNSLFISDASIWEMSIKRKKGNLRVDLEAVLQSSDFQLLPLSTAHILATENFDLFHQDPFDRLLVAQAFVEGLTLITHDKNIWEYPVSILRA